MPLIFRVVDGAPENVQGASIDMGSLALFQAPV